MSSLSPKMVANNLWEDCETMKRPAESTSIGDSDVTQRSCSSERSLRNFEPDGEDFFLLMKGKQRIRNGSWRSAWSWSTRVYISVTVVNIVLFSISILVLWTSHGVRNLSEQDHWRATSYYSPVFDRFTIPKHTIVTNGTFWDTDPPSIWRVRTGAATDAAWESVGSNITPIVITSADVIALGKDPATAVKVPLELNLGKDAYIAGMDVFHHLHCLDKLRREISYKHYHEAEEGPSPGSELHKAHINHCLDVLAQALKCTGSVDIVTFNWVEGHRMPQPDFNNKKVCRNFDKLRDWTVKNSIDGEKFLRIARKPLGKEKIVL